MPARNPPAAPRAHERWVAQTRERCMHELLALRLLLDHLMTRAQYGERYTVRVDNHRYY